LNLVWLNAVYRVVCVIETWPSQSWMARVSMPSFASLYPHEWRSMWKCTGSAKPALWPMIYHPVDGIRRERRAALGASLARIHKKSAPNHKT